MDNSNLISSGYFGRRILTTTYGEITKENVVRVLEDVLPDFEFNQAQIRYLHAVLRGEQAILNKKKVVRPEINFKIPVNRANEIVSFKSGYLVGEPLQYVIREESNEFVDAVHRLNTYMLFEKKPRKDMQLAKWLYTCGTSFRMVLPNPRFVSGNEMGEAPFRIFTLNPMTAFVVYNGNIFDEPVMGVSITSDPDDETGITLLYNIYTRDMFFKVRGKEVIEATPHILDGIPIVEYPANDERLGAFEIVLPLLDAMNVTASGRLDGLEQFINSLMKMKNADITAEDFEKLKDLGCIKIKGDNADVEFMTQELNQTQIQALVDWEYDAILTIVGMPNRNGGSSTSDTGAAVIMRDGWSDAEARAKQDEAVFKDSETSFLKIVLRICQILDNMKLNISNLDTRFTRRNYENIAQKSSVLVSLLQSGKVHPLLAFQYCGMFSDPNLAYEMSKQYSEEQEKKAQELMEKQAEKKKDQGGGGEDPTEKKDGGGEEDSDGES